MIFVISIPSGPVFDQRLEQALESIRIQNVSVRVALCDVSNDPRAHKLAQKYSDIIYYCRHGDDRGQSDAINEGWRAIKGDVYGWLNVDDVLSPGSLLEVKKTFKKNKDVDVIYGQSLIIKNNKYIGLHSEVNPKIESILTNNIISQPSCYVRRGNLFDANLLNINLHYTMDWDLWVRLYKGNSKFYYLPIILSTVSWDKDTKTANFNISRYKELVKIGEGSLSFIKRQKVALSFLLEHLANYGAVKNIFSLLLYYIRKKNNVSTNIWEPMLNIEYTHVSNQHKISVPIYHYYNQTKYKLRFIFENKSSRRIEILGHKSIVSSNKVITVPIKIQKSQVRTLNISSANKELLYLKSITYL